MTLTKTPDNPNPILQKIGAIGVIPVVTIDDASVAPQLAEALRAAKLPIAEITLRTDCALAAIAVMSARCPELAVGAGTVLTVAQAEAALNAGATFIVTPGFDEAVVDYCLAREVPIIPGVMTPTEINMALRKGLRLLKFFPAEVAGGINALRAICGPYRDLQFIPTGGVTLANLPDYLRLPQVFACGGSWLTPRDLLKAYCFDEIKRLAAEAVQVAEACRA